MLQAIVKMRPGGKPGGADIANDLLLFDALSCLQPFGITGKVPVMGPKTVAVLEDNLFAVAALHGLFGAYRDGFFAYLEGMYDGKGSSTRFKKALGLREETLEEAWHEHARALARIR